MARAEPSLCFRLQTHDCSPAGSPAVELHQSSGGQRIRRGGRQRTGVHVVVVLEVELGLLAAQLDGRAVKGARRVVLRREAAQVQVLAPAVDRGLPPAAAASGAAARGWTRAGPGSLNGAAVASGLHAQGKQ
jgi:hypothetical protein